MIESKERVLRARSSGHHVQEHVESKRVVAAETVADGIQVQGCGGRDTGLSGILVDGQKESERVAVAVRGRRDVLAAVVEGKDRGVIRIEKSVGCSEGKFPVRRAVRVEVVRE